MTRVAYWEHRINKVELVYPVYSGETGCWLEGGKCLHCQSQVKGKTQESQEYVVCCGQEYLISRTEESYVQPNWPII